MPPTPVDILISAAHILPISPDETLTLPNHTIAIHNNKILDLLPTPLALSKYTSPQTINRPNSILLPGLINAHTHTGLSLLRGRADDLPLLTWLQSTVWPLESHFASGEEFLLDGAMLAAAEMIRAGVTTFSDMYHFPAAAASAVVRSGMRALIGMPLLGFPTPYATNDEEYIARGEDVRKRFSGEERIRFAYAPHAPYTVSSQAWRKIKTLSEASALPVHTHLHETQDECNASLVLDRANPACHWSDNKCHPVEDLNRMGLLNSNLIAAHMVHLTDHEIRLVAEKGVHVVHCPTSNAKLASGFCRIPDLLKAGVNVAIGTDSAACNNSLDMLAEIKLAALFAKNVSGDATVLPAPMAIRMATINGARALGLEHVTGSLEVGKAADLICIDVGTHAGNSPMYNPHSAVVYAATREDVTDVMVDGNFLLREKKYCTLDIADTLRRTDYWRKQIEAYSLEK